MFFITFTLLACEPKELMIIGGSEVEVGCSILLEHNFKKGEEEWNSSDESIASVIDGMVIGKSAGFVTITLSIGENIAYKDIEVTEYGVKIIIAGVNAMFVGEEYTFNAKLSNQQNAVVEWESSDSSILNISESGKAKALKEGVVMITATLANTNNKASFRVVVTDNSPEQIIINASNKLMYGSTMQLEVNVYPTDAFSELIYESSDERIVSVSQSGLVTAVGVGSTQIKVSSKSNPLVFSILEIEVTLSAPEGIEIIGSKQVVQGQHSNYKLEVYGENVYNQFVWETSDETIAIVYQGIVLGLRTGKVTLTCYSLVDESVETSLEIEVIKRENEEYSQDDINRVNQILNNMTLSQKVGQMFVVGFSGTAMSSTLKNVIQDYNFGNVIYLAANVTNPDNIADLSNDIQAEMIESNTVPGFIAIDQEGGRVVRITNGATHFISNMAMGATGDYNNTYLEGLAMGKELINYGINVDFAPVLDVNNNPENPVIGIRSYSDNSLITSLYGKNMIKGLHEANVMACSKHFPGHGNTSVDSHYGLPTITSSKDDLYKIELAPFISAIGSGIDAIMTTHIIFTAIDSEYPATLSKKVLTGLLREELNYDGLIITDGMEMGAVTNNFGGYDNTAVLAVKAGVDILTYTSNTNPKKAHQALVNAVNNGEISVERINDSVRRILLKKLEYGILDNYQAKDEDINEMLVENEELNLSFAMQSLTRVRGFFEGLNKNRSTLIISPTTTYSLGSGLETNSFANYASNYLISKGHTNVTFATIDANITNSQSNELLELAKNYDQIIVAMSNVKVNSYSKSASFVNELAKMNKELVVIALDSPYDYMSYSENVKNYICVYGYQKASVIAISKYLNGEFEATGKLAVTSIK